MSKKKTTISAKNPKRTTAPKSAPLHKYHLVLGDGSERDVSAATFSAYDGGLVLVDGSGDPVVAYAPGEWKLCEREARDDRSADAPAPEQQD